MHLTRIVTIRYIDESLLLSFITYTKENCVTLLPMRSVELTLLMYGLVSCYLYIRCGRLISSWLES